MSGAEHAPAKNDQPQNVHDQDRQQPKIADRLHGSSGMAGYVLNLQRTIGNQATTQRLRQLVNAQAAPNVSRVQREDATPIAQAPAAGTTDKAPKWDIVNVVDEAMDRSPTFYKIYMSIQKRGYQYVWGEWGKGTYTNTAYQLIAIDPSVDRAGAVVRVMYEAGNAFFDTDFSSISADVRSGKFKTGEAYARALIEEETATVVTASKEAIEGGLVYAADVDAIVRKYLQPDPDGKGGMQWKPGVGVNAVIKKVFPLLWNNATSVDKSGRTAPARDVYIEQWAAITLLNKSP